MIHKAKDPQFAASVGRMGDAGAAAERQMAFYLNRAFASDVGVHIINDLRLELANGDALQIDHLVIHRHGMIIVESKSVGSGVSVNQRGEWTRRIGGREQGMPSPIEQARRQGDALRALLRSHSTDLRDRRLLGILPGGFKHCPMEVIVAISDNGIIERRGGADPPEVKKADQVAGTVRDIVERHRKAASLIGMMRSSDPKDDSGMYDLRESEIARIIPFLLSRHRPLAGPATRPATGAPEPNGELVPAAPPSVAEPPPGSAPAIAIPGHRCRHCGSHTVREVRWGNRAYYAVCAGCGKGTDLSRICISCGREGRIRKQGPAYFRDCPTKPQGCGRSEVIVVGEGPGVRPAQG